MHCFTDSEGRRWDVSINVATVRRVRAAAEVDLLTIIDRGSDLAERLSSDPVLLADVLYALLEPQIGRLGLREEDFWRGLAGQAIEDATMALLEELADFFPGAKGRAIRKVLEQLPALEARINQQVDELLDQVTPDQMLQQAGRPRS